jgi:hypothetical protein
VGHLGGPSGPLRRGPYPAWLGEVRFGFVAGFKWGFPSCLRGPLGLSPTPRGAPALLGVQAPTEPRPEAARTPSSLGARAPCAC